MGKKKDEARHDPVTIPLKLIVGSETRQMISQQGQPMSVEMRAVIQDDAGFLFTLVSAVDTAQESYKKSVKMVNFLLDELRPHKEFAEKQGIGAQFDDDEDDAPRVTISKDALDFICELIDKPPKIQTQQGERLAVMFVGPAQKSILAIQKIRDREEEEPDPKPKEPEPEKAEESPPPA